MTSVGCTACTRAATTCAGGVLCGRCHSLHVLCGSVLKLRAVLLQHILDLCLYHKMPLQSTIVSACKCAGMKHQKQGNNQEGKRAQRLESSPKTTENHEMLQELGCIRNRYQKEQRNQAGNRAQRLESNPKTTEKLKM
jgi:hypothetical protein